MAPDQSDITQCRKFVSILLHADLSNDPKLTELCTPLLEAWSGAANDPDKAVIKWLRSGAPAGIEAHPEQCGIFPVAEEPPSGEFELSYAAEGHRNYESMESSPYGSGGPHEDFRCRLCHKV